ncbi:MAG: hypothetical protein ACXADF_16265 [Candidatus Thorarchaeota archaeon]|jgi:hypothetical protein
MTNISDVMLKMFIHESKQARVVLECAKGTDLDFVPKEGMRPLKALANHLAQIPTMDPSMYRREIENGEQAQEKEKELWRDEIDSIISVFDNGVELVKKQFTGMSNDEFLAATLQPFYEQKEKKSWEYYFAEFTTHVSMHKMQLWMYLKLAGVDVNFLTYYGVPSES